MTQHRPFGAVITVASSDPAVLATALRDGSRVLSHRTDADTIVDAALRAGATHILWVAWGEDVVPDHPAVDAVDPYGVIDRHSLAETGRDTVVVLDRSALDPFGEPGDRLAVLGAAPGALATIRRAA
jgi:hypothetical protein